LEYTQLLKKTGKLLKSKKALLEKIYKMNCTNTKHKFLKANFAFHSNKKIHFASIQNSYSKDANINEMKNKNSIHFLDYNLPIAHVQSTLNNTIITLTDFKGNTLYWCSAGSCDGRFKNSRKSTSYAAQVTAEQVARFCNSKIIKKINVRLKGIGYGKEASLKGFQFNGVLINKIEDSTTIPHNGCRLPKKRRI